MKIVDIDANSGKIMRVFDRIIFTILLTDQKTEVTLPYPDVVL